MPVNLSDTIEMEDFLFFANESLQAIIEIERASGNWDTVWGQLYVYEF
jgi:hypothetical protein